MSFVKFVKSKSKAQYDALSAAEKVDKVFYLENGTDTSEMTDAQKDTVNINTRILVNGKDYTGVKRVKIGTTSGTINVDGVDVAVKDVITSHQDISGKADKVSGATNGNFAGLDSNGNLTDSGKKASDFISATEKGANNGVASLGSDGKVPASQLPSYVDDVIECLNFTDTAPASCVAGDYYYNTSTKKLHYATATNTWGPGTDPVGGKIYVNLSNSKTYRWGGTDMAEISASLALGETQGTAYEGSKGAANASAIQTLQADKVNRAEISIADVSGDSTKKNITLKSGTSQEVLVAHQDISGKANKAVPAAAGNVATLDASGNLSDSGKTLGKSVPADANFANTVSPVADTTNKKIYFTESSGADIYFIGGDMKVTVKDGHGVQFDANITPGTAVVSTSASQGLSTAQQGNARTNIGAASTAVVNSSANGLMTPDMLAALEWE